MPMTATLHKTPRNRRPGLRALLFALLLGTGLAGALLLARGPVARYLAQRWQRQLDQAREEELPLWVQQIAALGDAGVPALVAGLGSPREATARAVKQALLVELEHWKSLERDDYQPKLELLAQTLARQVSDFGPTARCDAAELAVRILREFPASARGTILSACETVLRITASERHLLADQELGTRLSQVPSAKGPNDSPVVLAAAPAWTRPLEMADPFASAAALAGGALPVEISAGVGEAKEHALAEVQGPTSPLKPVEGVCPERLPALEEASPLAASPPSSFPTARPSEPGPAKAEVNKPLAVPDRLAGLDTVELMRQLQVGNVRDVEAELRQRGFNDVQLELARQLFDSDPQVRRQLAERLPSLQSIDAVPWLLQLCRDTDVEVRALAVSLIATTGDPKLRLEAERIARLDADPRVKIQAERLAKQGQKTRR